MSPGGIITGWLAVFKTDRMVRIQPGDLDSAREPWRDYYRLTGSPPRSPAAPAAVPEAGTASTGRNPPDRGKERD